MLWFNTYGLCTTHLGSAVRGLELLLRAHGAAGESGLCGMGDVQAEKSCNCR
jgi:hypothetical protein